MDEFMEETDSNGTTMWTKKIENEDGTYTCTKVEKVSNGFIKCVEKSYKDGDKWEYESTKSIHESNPMEEPSMIEKLAQYLKD
jgi:hypothetical protein